MTGVIVMGAGAAGFGAALELAERGYSVQLIEKDTLSSGSSGRNPGRMGHGFHYIDVETAKMYLRASIQVQRKYPDYLVGKEYPFEHPLRHGRYFITKDSDNSPEEILDTYQKIKDEYKKLVEEDPKNEVFGPPDNFYRILTPNEYVSQVQPGIVSVGVETAEHLFDWKSFIEDVRANISANKNIELHENTEILTLERGDLHEPRFTVHALDKKAKKEVSFHADYLVNSTWQNIETFNEQLGFTMIPSARTNRLKALVVVKLPPSLELENSMFFCMGQHCMFSNLGKGYGMLTFANVTNMETSSGLLLSERAQKLIDGDVSDEEKNIIGMDILSGVAKYIPEMAKASIVAVKFGIVQTAGKLELSDLRDPKNGFHKRDYDGIREEQVGLTSNPCMKLFYFVRNGKEIADLIDKEVIATQLINEAMSHIDEKAKSSSWDLHKEIKKTILGIMERSVSSAALPAEVEERADFKEKMVTALYETMSHKKSIMNQIKENGAKVDLRTYKEAIDHGFLMQIMNSMPKEKHPMVPVVLGLIVMAVGVALLSPPLALVGGLYACCAGGASALEASGLLEKHAFFSCADNVSSFAHVSRIEAPACGERASALSFFDNPFSKKSRDELSPSAVALAAI